MDKRRAQKKSIVSFGFYWRKLVFFGSLFVLAIFSLQLVGRFQADSGDFDYAIYSETPSSDMYIRENGKIIVGENKTTQKISIMKDFDEVRTPVIDVPGIYMDEFTVNLHLPAEANAADVQYEILGIHGVESTEVYIKDSKTITYKAYGVGPSSTLSIIAKLPKGVIHYSPLDLILFSLRSMDAQKWLVLSLIIPIITALIMFIFIFRTLARQKVEVPAEEINTLPMAIPPAIVGVLYRQKVTSREIAATLIDLAIRGNIFILDRERDFAFAKNNINTRLLGYEKILLSKIFTEKIFSNREEIEERINSHLYSKKISLYTSGVYALATRLGYFKINPQSLHAKYRLGGIAGFLFALAGFLISFTFSDYPYLSFIWIGLMIASMLFVSFASKVPIRTPEGGETLSNWLAFRKFLTNKEKIPFSYDNAIIFQRYLPYAIALDCEIAWAKRFASQGFTIPKWFVSSRGNFGLQDFCLSLFPIVSYIGRSLSSIREPGFD